MVSLSGTIFWLLLFISSLLGSLFFIFPLLPLVWIAPRIWRSCIDHLVGYWLLFPVSLCEYVFAVKFYLSGDKIDHREPALIIMNHRTRLDWLFFWNALYKMDPRLLSTEKITLKKMLKCIPGVGWAMQCAAYIFLERNYEKDSSVLDNLIIYYKAVNRNYQILLFPEGTDRGTRAVSFSDAYAEKHNLQKYSFVLHPRTAGFIHLLRLMRKQNYIKYVYDVTIGYSGRIVSSEMELLRDGHFPSEVHFDVKRYGQNELPDEDNAAADWLKQLWCVKESRLKQFYEADTTKRTFSSCSTIISGVVHSGTVVFWISASLFWIYISFSSRTVLIYVLLACAIFSFCQWKFDGIEQWALRYFQLSAR